MVTADDFKDYKKGFNNQFVCFEYPFLWNDIKSEEEDEFTLSFMTGSITL